MRLKIEKRGDGEMKGFFAKRVKRFIALVLTVCVCLPGFNPVTEVTVAAEGGFDAVIKFNYEKYGTGVESFSVGSKTGVLTTPTVTTREGEECWEISTTEGGEYLYIDFDRSIGSSLEDGSVYDIEIDYLDLGKGFLYLWYDDLNYGKQLCGEIYGENTKAWKTYKLTLENAGFSGGLNGHDFMMSVRTQMRWTDSKSDVSAFVKEMRVKRRRNAQPVLAESYIEESGNIFCHTDEEKLAKVTYTNTTAEEQMFAATYRLVDDYGVERWNKSETITVKGKGKQECKVNFDTDYCGLYTLYIDIKNESLDYRIKEDTLAIVKRNEDGSQSESMIVAAEAIRGYGFSEDVIREQYDIVKKANFAGVRGGEIDLLAESGLELLNQVFGAFSSRLNYAAWTMPETDEDFALFEQNVRSRVETMLKYGFHKYELWNEPNVAAFVNGQDPETMAEMQKRFYKIVKELDPEAIVTGLSITMLGGDSANYWYNGVMDKDFYKYIDGLALHPYEMRVVPEEAKMDLKLAEYKKGVVDKKGEDIVVFNTEYGHTTADNGVTSKVLADWFVRDTIIFKLSNVGDLNTPYNVVRKGPQDNDREESFGMTSPAQSDYNVEGKVMIPRAAYVTMAAMSYMITDTANHNAEWLERGENLHAGTIDSRKFNAKVMPMWVKSGTETVTMHLGTNKIDLYDGYGNKKTLESDDGIYTFYLTERMQYAVGDIKDYRLIGENRYSFDMDSLNSSNLGVSEIEISDNEETGADISIKTAFECEEKSREESDGKKTFAVLFRGEVGDMRHVEVDITKDGKLVSTASVPVTIIVPTTLSIDFEPSGNGGYDKWKGVITIQNNLKTMVEGGYIEFSEPQLFANLGRINLGFIPRDKTVRVKFDCPSIRQKGMYSLGYTVIFDSGNSYSEKQLVDFTMATYAENKPVIDGKADEGEWPTDTAMKADSSDYVKFFSNMENNNWRGTDDLSAEVRMMWDEEKLYMFSTVKDDVERNAAEEILKGWNGDSIQFGLYLVDGDEFVAIGDAGVNFHEFIIAKLDNGKIGTYMNKVQTTAQTPRLLETAETAIVRGDGVTTYEVSIPWAEITKDCWIPFKAETGVKIGFSILWNDDDGDGRRGWMEYASGIGQFKDSSQFTFLNLVK